MLSNFSALYEQTHRQTDIQTDTQAQEYTDRRKTIPALLNVSGLACRRLPIYG